MVSTPDLTTLVVSIANHDYGTVVGLLNATPALTTEQLGRRDEFFLAERLAQLYEGDTALHAAAFSYDSEMARLFHRPWRRLSGQKSAGR